jgi:hypothetical protein
VPDHEHAARPLDRHIDLLSHDPEPSHGWVQICV